MLLSMRFLGEFEEMLYFQGVDGIFGVIVVIFGDVKSGEMLDFVRFARSWYRSGVLNWIDVKCLGNADFTRSLWMEEICRFYNRTLVLKM